MVAQKSHSTELSLQELWWRSGLVVTPSRDSGKNVKAGHELINKMLGGDVVDGDVKNPPILFFVEGRCNTLIHHMYNLAYKIDESKAATEGTLSTEFNEHHKHGVDIVRYMVQMPIPYIEPALIRQKADNRPAVKKGFFAYA